MPNHNGKLGRTERLFGPKHGETAVEWRSFLVAMRASTERTLELEDYDPDATFEGIVHDEFRRLLLTHLDVTHEFGDPQAIGGRTLQAADHYFFGPWRDRYVRFEDDILDRARCARKLEWWLPYREALAVALLMDDEAAIRRLAGYPRHVIADDEVSDEAQSFHIWLALTLCDEPAKRRDELTATIRGSRRRLPRLWLEAYLALEAGDAQAFRAALGKSLTLFRKQLEPGPSLHEVIDLDGTILWNLARRRELAPGDLALEDWDVLLTPASCGLTPG